MRNLVLISALLIIGAASPSTAKDMEDRTLGLELNRDRSESRIERLREDKQREDKARAEAPKKRDEPKSRLKEPADR